MHYNLTLIIPCIFLQSNIIQRIQSVIHHLWHASNPTCFGTQVSSSGSRYNKDVQANMSIYVINGVSWGKYVGWHIVCVKMLLRLLVYYICWKKNSTGSLTFYLRTSDVFTRVDFSCSTSKVHYPVLNMVLLQDVTIYRVDINTFKFWRAKYPSHRRNLGRGCTGWG
jgi:hypothetical protein